jgi:gliding motility-associated-like protein
MKNLNTVKYLYIAIMMIAASVTHRLHAQIPTTSFEITNILINACGSPEGNNEMFSFITGPDSIRVSGLTVKWSVTSQAFNGFCHNATTALKTDSLNKTIRYCGYILEPLNDTIPPGKQVVVVTSAQMATAFQSFASITDTIYILYQCFATIPSGGHFGNSAGAKPPQILTYYTGYADTVIFTNASSTPDGAAVSFTHAGVPTYVNTGCKAPIVTPPAGSITASGSSIISYCNGMDTINLSGVATGKVFTHKWLGGKGRFADSSQLVTKYVSSKSDTFPLKLYLQGYLCSDSILDSITISRIVTTYPNPQTRCNGGDPYVIGAHSYRNPGVYYDTLVKANGCDSIVITTLKVDTLTTHRYDTICKGGSVTFYGMSYDSTGVYIDTLLNIMEFGGCDTLAYLHLTVYPVPHDTIYDTICKGKFFTFNGVSLNTAGTYDDTLLTVHGCDSFVTLHLAIKDTSTYTIYDTICANNPVTFNGVGLSASGTYRDTLVAANGCDSFVTLRLLVYPIASDTIYDTICSNKTFAFNGSLLNVTGTYLDTLVNQYGCDSFLTLMLKVVPTKSTQLYDTICSNGSATFDGNVLTKDSVYLSVKTTVAGCDSFVFFHLTVLPTSAGTRYDTICKGSFFAFNGSSLSAAGTYQDTIVAVNGCDSFLTLQLAVKDTATHTRYDTICQGKLYSFNGNNLTVSGIYRDTLVATNGCDSFLTLRFTVLTPASHTIYDSVCKGKPYVFNGNSLTVSGTYLDTLVAANTCDSFLTLQFKILQPTTHIIYDTICDGKTYSFNGANLTTAGSYLDTLVGINTCDSILTLQLYVRAITTTPISATVCAGGAGYSFNGAVLTAAGVYYDTLTSIHGCDSIIKLTLTLNSPSAKSITGTICNGGVYVFGGKNLTTAGTFTDTVPGSNTCDSVTTLVLTVNQPSSFTQTISKCPGGVVIVGGNVHSTTGSFVDVIKNKAGCDSTVTTNLTILPAPISIQTKADSCFKATINGVVYRSTAEVKYTIKSSLGCDSILHTDSIFIYKPAITIQSSYTLPISLGDSTQLTIQPTGTYYNILWTPDSNLAGQTNDTVLVAPMQSRTYIVAADDSATKCRVTASIEIPVSIPIDSFYVVPNAFSPNGDGTNDLFRVLYKPGTEILDFSIYNRWGQKIYDVHTDNPHGWDGTYVGETQPLGVYSYFINLRYTPTNQSRLHSGNFTLIR